MSSVNFDRVYEKTPDLREAANVMREWLSAHDEQNFLDTITLAKAIGTRITPDKILRVLAQLVATGQVKVQYAVSLPDGTLTEEFYDEPSEVPPVVFDSTFQPVSVDDRNIVPVYLTHSR